MARSFLILSRNPSGPLDCIRYPYSAWCKSVFTARPVMIGACVVVIIGERLLIIRPVVPSMSCSSYWDGLWDGRQVAVQLFYEVLLPGLVQHIAFLYSFHQTFSLSVSIVHPYYSNEMATAWKKTCFILSDLLHKDSLSKAADAFHMAYVDMAFNRWDTAVEICELVWSFQEACFLK